MSKLHHWGQALHSGTEISLHFSTEFYYNPVWAYITHKNGWSLEMSIHPELTSCITTTLRWINERNAIYFESYCYMVGLCTFNIFSIIFKNEWGKRKRLEKLSAHKRKLECAGMVGVGGWLEQRFSKYGPETCHINHIWKIFRNINLRPYPWSTESESLLKGWGTQKSIV